MRVLLTGYGTKQPSGEPQPFKSMRLEIDLNQNDAIEEGGVVQKKTGRRTRSLILKGRTRKVNREAFDNDVAVHLHDLSPKEALVLAAKLIRFAHDGYSACDWRQWTLECQSERQQLLYEIFNTSANGEDEDHRSYLVPLDEFLQIVGYIEQSARTKVDAQEVFQDPIFSEHLTEANKKKFKRHGEQGRATLRTMSMLRRFYSTRGDEQKIELVVVGNEGE